MGFLSFSKKVATLLLIFLMFGCVSTKTVDKAVVDRYQNALVKKLHGSNFSVANVISKDTLVRTKKIKSEFIPALFYWKSSATFKVNLDNYVSVNLWNKYADDYANSIHLKDKLNGRRIELDLVSIPSELEYKQTRTTVFLIIAASVLFQNRIQQNEEALHVKYKTYEGDVVADSGSIVVEMAELNEYSEHLNQLQKSSISPKLFIKEYLNVYENQIYLMSKIFIDKLSSKL